MKGAAAERRDSRSRSSGRPGAGKPARSASDAVTLRANRQAWAALVRRLLPFADAATPDVPLARLLRLSLFQVSAGMVTVLLAGTLNRVMIVELGVAAWLVAAVIALPVLIAPLRALIGHRSDQYRGALGWRRTPYAWAGAMLQFGGLAIMPFALIVLSGDHNGPAWVGPASAALAFVLVGSGVHVAQTAGLALAADLVAEEARPRAVALLHVSLLLGMLAGSLAFGLLLSSFSQIKLIQVIQGAAVVAILLNVAALWKQEPRRPGLTRPDLPRATLRQAWAGLGGGRFRRLMVAVALGTAGFAMQDALLEPYGGEVLGLSVAATTALTALWAAGALLGFAHAARKLSSGADPHRLAALGAVIGLAAFSAVIFAEPLQSPNLFRAGAFLIGLGSGLFGVGTLTAVVEAADGAGGAAKVAAAGGLALGAWGAVQATATGASIALGGALRDGVGALADAGALGVALQGPAVGYGFVYHAELVLLFAALAALGPLARAGEGRRRRRRFGLEASPA